jgi:hypothetical protein
LAASPSERSPSGYSAAATPMSLPISASDSSLHVSPVVSRTQGVAVVETSILTS